MQRKRPISTFARLAVLRVSLILFFGVACAQTEQEGQEPPPLETLASRSIPDTQLPKITAALQSVMTRDVAALARVLHTSDAGGSPVPGTAPNTLAPIGDLDGDGVPEMLLKWAMPEVTAGVEVAPAPDSRPLWSVYLLSWDGARWKVSRLVAGVEGYTPIAINLGPPLGRGVALVMDEGDSAMPYPAIFQIRDHAATLLWDGQSDASLYKPFLQGQVNFRDYANAPAEMIATGRADPGLLRFDPNGHRGFPARAVYHWDGKAFTPAKTEYTASQDYTVYRFISALHLHDYRSAYALVAPAKLLNLDSPTLDAFRQYIQDNFPEFLRDEVFDAPELPAGSPDAHIFVLSKPGTLNVYHPLFSGDGRFLLTGLSRTHEAQE
jgi:hypothetical protein